MRKSIHAFGIVVLVTSLVACSGGSSSGGSTMTPPPHPAFTLKLEPIISGLSFPVFATAPNDGSNRLFIVEKGGIIKILNLATGQVLATPFLNVSSQIATSGEQGLLGLAFHPNFDQNGFFYVNLINLNGDTEIRRYGLLNQNQADTTSATLVIRIDQPAGLTNHKAGWLGFGPDGFLYVALGDGGGGGDPGENAENLNSLLGKMLRLNVDNDQFPADPDRNYAIPPGNPFAGAIAGLDEIWSYGLRNPWRSSFDHNTGDFYIADVGQGRWEEVNVATQASGRGAGSNFGWDIMEGSVCHEPIQGCNQAGLVMPLVEYDHSGGACSITGGYVYRGNVIPALQGTYFYADYCLGFVRSFRLVNETATEQANWPMLDPNQSITSFGEDQAGELYIVTQQGGLYRIVQN